MLATKVWYGGNLFRFLNEEHQVNSASDWNRREWGKLWLYNLHYFDFLRQADLPENEANKWIERWINENPPVAGNGWEPYTLSLRIVNWIKWAVAGHCLSPEALHSLAIQIRYLMRRREKHLLANHYLANAKALVFAGMFFQGPEAAHWLNVGCDIYRAELPEQILSDGGHFERSPMYHSIILEDLLDLYNLKAPLFLEYYIERMLKYLAVMTGPDGEIARFNDAAAKIALSPQQLFAYAQSLGFTPPQPVSESIDLPVSGYARLSNNNWTVICDGAPIGPDYQPGHAHADTLTFELWYKNQLLLANSGTKEYILTASRRNQRSSAGHNVMVIDNKDSSEVWSAHRVGHRAYITEREFAPDLFTASHNGYRPLMQQRSWKLTENSLVICDKLQGRGCHQMDCYWHFAPGVQIQIAKSSVQISSPVGDFTLTLSSDWQREIISGYFSPEFGLALPSLILHGKRQEELPFVQNIKLEKV